MLSTLLIVTPLWPSICKPMNSLKVSIIAGFYTDISKKILSGSPFNTTPPVKVQLTQCKSITSLNEMLTCSWDKHTDVSSSQLAPSIRFYILWNKIEEISCIDQHFLVFFYITFCKSKLNIFICHTSSSRNNSKHIWSLIDYFKIKETIFIFLSEVYIS